MAKLIERTTVIGIKIHAIPKSWVQAAGLLKNKKRALTSHIKKARKDWEAK